MSADLKDEEISRLMELPAFRKFMFAAIQLSGMYDRATNGTDGRDLSFAEGRRSLGLDILALADRGQPKPLQHAHSIATHEAIIREITQIQPEEAHDGTRDSYDRDDD